MTGNEGRYNMSLRKLAATALVGGIAAVLSVAVASPAQAAETQCRGALGPVVVAGDVVVPAGESCLLDGTTVRGNVVVRRDAVLATVDARVTGNIRANDATSLVFTGTIVGGDIRAERRTRFVGEGLTVNGNLQAKQVSFFHLLSSSANGTFTVENAADGSIFCGNRLSGNAEFRDNRTLVQIGGSPDCAGNDVEGNVIVRGNRGNTTIGGNTIGGNLTCRNNQPPPVGGGNIVEGNKEGQCATL